MRRHLLAPAKFAELFVFQANPGQSFVKLVALGKQPALVNDDPPFQAKGPLPVVCEIDMPTDTRARDAIGDVGLAPALMREQEPEAGIKTGLAPIAVHADLGAGRAAI